MSDHLVGLEQKYFGFPTYAAMMMIAPTFIQTDIRYPSHYQKLWVGSQAMGEDMQMHRCRLLWLFRVVGDPLAPQTDDDKNYFESLS